MKYANEIVKWGKVKRFNNRSFKFNSIDIETINHEVFLIGNMINDKHYYRDCGFFFDYLNHIFIKSVQQNADIVTWTRYDNTFIIKTIIGHLPEAEQYDILRRIGKISPLYSWEYNGFTFSIDNIIADNIILKVIDRYENKKVLNIYNLKNLFPNSDLVTAAKEYHLDYYSKLGEEFHNIDKARYDADPKYKAMVIKANYLDNKVIIDLANKLVNNFHHITDEYPRTMYTAGSLARAYLLTKKDVHFNFTSLFRRSKHFFSLLDYSMQSYHGGKIESYVLGFIARAKIADITSAYPYVLTMLPQLTKKVIHGTDIALIDKYFYVFIKCVIRIEDAHLIHPVSVKSPVNISNISPYGTFEAIITKPEYEYLLAHGAEVKVSDFYAVEHIEGVYPYRAMINELFDARIINRKDNKSLSELYKLILNSLYGITYELTDVFDADGEWMGYRAGDFFNPLIASYITALTRVNLSEVSNNIIENGGEVYLNMTDSIIYNGKITLDVFSDKKILGKYERPTSIDKVLILGAGRYEYRDEFTKAYVIKTRGFSVKVKTKSFYSDIPLVRGTTIKNKTLVTFFKATTKKFNYKKLGHIIEEDYEINPFNLGGKRIIDNTNIDLKTEYTTTRPILLGDQSINSKVS